MALGVATDELRHWACMQVRDSALWRSETQRAACQLAKAWPQEECYPKKRYKDEECQSDRHASVLGTMPEWATRRHKPGMRIDCKVKLVLMIGDREMRTHKTSIHKGQLDLAKDMVERKRET